jgi:hypothetical protein
LLALYFDFIFSYIDCSVSLVEFIRDCSLTRFDQTVFTFCPRNSSSTSRRAAAQPFQVWTTLNSSREQRCVISELFRSLMLLHLCSFNISMRTLTVTGRICRPRHVGGGTEWHIRSPSRDTSSGKYPFCQEVRVS